MTANMHKISFGGDKNVLELDSDDGCITVNIMKPLNCTL